MSEDIKKVIYMLHPLERKVLPHLGLSKIDEIAKASKLKGVEVVTAIDLLEERGFALKEKLEQEYVGLDKFGLKYVKSDLPEIKFLKEILSGPKCMDELKLEKEEFSSAWGILKKEGLIEITKDDKGMRFGTKDGASDFVSGFESNLDLFEKEVPVVLMSDLQKEVFDKYSKRKGFLKKFVKTELNVTYTLRGEEVAREIVAGGYEKLNLVESLTSEMLKTGSWKNKKFRHYETSVDVPVLDIGRRHPMVESNNIVRDIFVEMGFCEMEGPMVESEFWCFDTLWIPQDHPARDEQDTFFLDGSAQIAEDVVFGVAKMHEEGLKRGHTPSGGFSYDVTKRRILRTHSTSATFRLLYELGKKNKRGEDVNGKYFYVANNFRNEAVDATHLAEFFQAEGCIIADDLSLGDLMGFIKEYYAKLGLHKIKFKPTFNPYTEPSMEAHYYDEKMGKWYALINSGIFRGETLEPLGLSGKTIIGFGMGATRVAALLSNAENLRQITGATCDFEWLKSRPVMRRELVRKGGAN